MSFTRLTLASFHLQRGAKLLGTNPDKFTMEAGFKVPGNGSMLSCLEAASGVKADIVGKPNTFILNHLIEIHKVQKEQCLMIGDNI
jgi:4-nitrophenyl phosphatase